MINNRILNYRPLLFIFIGLIVGINIVVSLFTKNLTMFITLLVVSCLLIIFFIIYSVILYRYKNDEDLKYVLNNKCYKNRSLLTVKGVTLFFLAIILGASCSLAVLGINLNKSDSIIDGNDAYKDTVVTGRVCESVKNQYIVLENVNENDRLVKGIKIKVYLLNDNLNFDVGDIVKSDVRLFKNNIINQNKLNTSAVINKIYYNAFFNGDSIYVKKGSTTIFEKIRVNTKSTIENYISQDNAGTVIALLIGDKNYITNDVYDSFKLSGVAHLLCISGLHIGFIYSLIMLLLKKLKVSNVMQFVICSIILIFYMAICGFANPVVRASIMFMCIMLSTLTKKRYDSISSLSLAGILLCFINPFNVVEIGFKLSFLAVLGLILLFKPFKNFFLKLKLPDIVASSFAVTLSVEIITLPIVAETFGFIPVIGLISNLLIIPVFGIIFGMLFVVFVINIILPLGFLYVPFNFVFTSLTSVITILSKVRVFKIVKFGSIATVVYYILILFVSRFNMLSIKPKTVISLMLVVIFALSFVLYNFTCPIKNNSINVIDNVDNSLVVRTLNNNTILIGVGDGSTYQTRCLLNAFDNLRLKSIDYVVLPNFNENLQDTIIEICSNIKIKNVVVPSTISNSTQLAIAKKLPSTTTISTIDDEFVLDNIAISPLKVDGTLKAIKIDMLINKDNKILFKNILLVQNNITQNQADSLLNLGYTYDIVLANNYSVGLDSIFNSSLKLDFKIIIKNSQSCNSSFVSSLTTTNFITLIDSLYWTYCF